MFSYYIAILRVLKIITIKKELLFPGYMDYINANNVWYLKIEILKRRESAKDIKD